MKTKIFIFIFLMMTFVTQAQIIHIPSDYSSIQEGINAAADGDTVLVAEGTYFENINFNGKAITVASKFILDGDDVHIAQTVIDGSFPVHPDSASTVNLFGCKDTISVLKGFTITGGKGIKEQHPTAGLVRAGGGISMDGGKIENNIITGNSINTTYYAPGGGIAIRPYDIYANAVIRNNSIFNNSLVSTEMAQGAGIYAGCEKGVTIVENNKIFENSATCSGNYKANAGGIMMATGRPWEATFIVRNNLIAENSVHCIASHGGGIFLTFPSLGDGYKEGKSGIEIYNNIIANNYSEDRGGGIAIWDQLNGAYNIEHPNPLIYNNTIIGNEAIRGAGIFNFEMNALLFNNIFWNNGQSIGNKELSLYDINYIYGPLTNHGKFQSYYNDIKGGWPGAGNIDKDAITDPDDFSLTDISPCIGRGIDSVNIKGNWYYAPAYDLEGANRLMASTDQKIDMGAIESSFNKPLNSYDSETVINIPTEQPTIQAGINAASDGDTVLVDEGYYYENINFKGKAITVASSFILDGDDVHIAQTVIDGSMPAHPDTASVVFIGGGLDSTTVLSGFTITGGKGSKRVRPTRTIRTAGGIFIELSGAKVENNIITGNSVTDPTYEVTAGGILGVNNETDQNLVIRNNRIFNNHIQGSTYTQGGGILVAEPYGLKLIENNDIFQNTATCTGKYKANGGGITIGTWEPWNTPIIVRNNRIYENEIHCVASQGGGIFLTFPEWGTETHSGKAPIEIYNNLIANNYSEDRGGGIGIWDQGNGAYNVEDPNPLIYNNTIIGNKAIRGAGIFNFEMNALLFNNIFWNNGLATGNKELSLYAINYIYGPYTNHGKFQSYHNNIKGGWPGAGNIDKDAKTDPDDFSLTDISPCIGRGIDSVHINGNWYYAPAYDLEGANRLMASTDGEIDMGALESSFERLNPQYDSEHIINVPEEESSIQAAINTASESDTVLIAPGLYYENINFKGKAITVMSHYGMDKDIDHQTNTVIDGSLPLLPKIASVVTFSSGEDTTSVLKGFTITGGKGSEVEPFPGIIAKGGGGINMFSSGGKIESNIIIGNKVESTTMEVAGGGLFTGKGVIMLLSEITKFWITKSFHPGLWGQGFELAVMKDIFLLKGMKLIIT